MAKVIKVGDTWKHTMLIGWAMITSKIIARDRDVVVEEQRWNAEDTGEPCRCEEIRHVKRDENGNEYITCLKYMGEEFNYYGENEEE